MYKYLNSILYHLLFRVKHNYLFRQLNLETLPTARKKNKQHKNLLKLPIKQPTLILDDDSKPKSIYPIFETSSFESAPVTKTYSPVTTWPKFKKRAKNYGLKNLKSKTFVEYRRPALITVTKRPNLDAFTTLESFVQEIATTVEQVN